MTKYRYPDLVRFKPRISKLEIQSYDLSIYLVKLSFGDESGMLYDGQDKLMQFAGPQAIIDAFELIPVENAELLHYSAFDEMIGNPDNAQLPLRVPFTF